MNEKENKSIVKATEMLKNKMNINKKLLKSKLEHVLAFQGMPIRNTYKATQIWSIYWLEQGRLGHEEPWGKKVLGGTCN